MSNEMRKWLDANAGQTYKNYVNGEWTDSQSGQTKPLYEAAIQDHILGYFPNSDEKDVDQAVRAADNAFQTWKHTSSSERAAILYRLADLLEKNRDELAYILSAEQGKVLGESLGEVSRAASEARFAAGESSRVEGMLLPSETQNVETKVKPYPIGVIAEIAPWNFPLVTPVRKIAPALAFGCTVVLKPASSTPWTSIKLMALMEEAGIPKGVVNVIIGSGRKIGDTLVSHPLVKGVSFTGSTALGLKINQVAASRLAKTQLELGGKNAAIILDYDNLDEAASQIVSAAFGCTGQRCTAISRVIVLKDQLEELVNKLLQKMSLIHTGPAWEEGTTMGPLVDKNQYDSVMNYVEIGKKEGAQLVTGGERIYVNGSDKGYYMAPTLFTNVTKEMRIAKEEIFGPVLVVLEAKNSDEAAEIANATEYGLAASVFTNTLEQAQKFTDHLETGMVHINHGTASQTHVPFGGVKNSGYGAFSIGHSNQEFFTTLKTIYVKR